MLHPTTVQRFFPIPPRYILLTHLGKTELHHCHHLDLLPHFQQLYQTTANIPILIKGLNFPWQMMHSMHRPHPLFGDQNMEKFNLLYIYNISFLELFQIISTQQLEEMAMFYLQLTLLEGFLN